MTGFRRKRRWIIRVLTAVSVTIALTYPPIRPAFAQIGSDRYASIVVDAASGDILSSVNADEYRYPASLTKMMTLYMLFEALRDRRLAMTQQVPVSPSAASMSPSKLGLLPGTVITVEQAVLGLVTKSANDAAAALGELMGGDEERFAEMMTLRARALGMTRTTFRNASGLPDWGQVTTARDMALLARHLIQDFPSYYWYFSVPSFVFQGRMVMSHQHMLQTYPGADGLKTGYIEASGFNVVTSALWGSTRLIGVVLGAASGWERDQHMASLLDQGFERMGAPMLTARHDAASPFGLNGVIGVAQAAPDLAPPGLVLARPAGRRGPAARGSQFAGSLRIHAAAHRRAPESRSERVHARPIVAFLPPRSFAAPPHAAALTRDILPLRARRSGGTRTARWAGGRIPG
jgi:D-alanyl-D-alanine carboxypeptidase